MRTFLAFLLAANLACAYLYSRAMTGNKIHWRVQAPLTLYVDPQNSSANNISEDDVMSAVEESVRGWNAAGTARIRAQRTRSAPSFGQGATLRFSSNPAYFGAGVLAVTSLSYNHSSGEVYSADILMNDSDLKASEFSSSKFQSGGAKAYLGDVITHELGHLLGLNHSETINSSMLFSIFKGQHSVHSDDILGAKDLYSAAGKSGVKGIVAGKGGAPVFGAYVQAIDLETNQTAAGVFSGEDGAFEIKGLDPDRSYVLYMSPMRSKENLPEYFKGYRDDYCDGKSFQPSFYSACGGRGAGRAQAIRPARGELTDIGTFGIRCSTGVDPDYMRQKFGEESDYVFLDYAAERKSASNFTGYFTEAQIDQGASGRGDRLKVDLTGLDPAGGQLYLEATFSFEKLGTDLGAEVLARRADEFSASYHSFGSDPETGRPTLDFTVIKALSADSDDNLFSFEVYPKELSKSEKTEVFAAPGALTNKRAVYFVTARVKRSIAGKTEPLEPWDDYPYNDNSACLEGDSFETARAYNQAVSNTGPDETPQGMSCASVDAGSGSGPGGGMGSFLLGAAAVLLMLAPRPKRRDFFV